MTLHLEPVDELQLLDETALFAGAYALGAGVEEEPDLLRPLDGTVEIVGPDGVLVFVGGQPEAFAQFRRDEGRRHRPAGEDTFVAGEYDEVAEVEGAGFERPHYLHAAQRLSGERHRLCVKKLAEQPPPGFAADRRIEFAKAPQYFPAVHCELQFHGPVCGLTEDFRQQQDNSFQVSGVVVRFAEDGFEERPGGEFGGRNIEPGCRLDVCGTLLFILVHGALQHSVGKQGPHLYVVEGGTCGGVANALLQGSEKSQKRRPFAALHGVAHGDVDIAYGLRNAVQHRHQQALVGQHYGSVDIVRRTCLPEYLREELGLSNGRRHAHYVNLRLAGELVLWQILTETFQVLRHEEGRTVRGVAYFGAGIIPAELRQTGLFHCRKELALAFVEGVEAGEHEARARLEMRGQYVCHAGGFQFFGQMPVEGSFVAEAFVVEARVEAAVERQQYVPDAQEIPFHGSVFLEIAEELPHRKLLVAFEETEVLHLLELLHILPELFRIGQVLVHIVEVAQYHASPIEEFVERLGVVHQGTVALVEQEQLLYAVGFAAVCGAADEIAHGEALGGKGYPPVSSHHFAEVFLEESYGSPAGKDKTQAVLGRGACVIMFSNLSKELLHRRSVIIQALSSPAVGNAKLSSEAGETVMPEALKSRSLPPASTVQERLCPSKRRFLTMLRYAAGLARMELPPSEITTSLAWASTVQRELPSHQVSRPPSLIW